MDNNGYRSYGEYFGRIVGVVVALILVFFVVLAIANLASNDDGTDVAGNNDESISLDAGSSVDENSNGEVNTPIDEDTETTNNSTDTSESEEVASSEGNLPNTGPETSAILAIGVFTYFLSNKFVFNSKQ